MNLADLSSLLTVLIVAIGIPGAANASGAPFWVVLITLPVASGIGILAAFANGRMMYRFLGVPRKNEKRSEGNLFLYMVWPLVWWSASTAGAVAIGSVTASLIQK